MKSLLRLWWVGIGAVAFLSAQPPVLAQENVEPEPVEQAPVEAAPDDDVGLEVERDTDEPVQADAEDERSDRADRRERIEERIEQRVEERIEQWRHGSWDDNENVIVNFFGDSLLPAGEESDAVVAIAGSATSAGKVRDSVIALLGTATATGPVGQSVVSVLGNTRVDTEVGDDVVAVFGNVDLGPNARIDGEVVAVFGKVTRHPQAVVDRGVQQFGFAGDWEGLRQWVRHCLMLGRPLAFEPGLGWAWGLALGSLAFYVLIALMFPAGIDRCVSTLEVNPGYTLLASVIALLLSPVVMVLLAMTGIGLALLPVFFIALLFGKAAVLATIGRRLTRHAGESVLNSAAIAVLVGGVIVLALYVVPVVGFITMKLLGIVGFGLLIYTLLVMQRERRDASLAATPRATAAPVQPAFVGTPETPVSPLETSAGPTMESTTTTVPPVTEVPPAIAATTLVRADFWIRMGALFIDAVLVGLVINVILEFLDDYYLVSLATYGALMWKFRGTTVGGSICGLRVVRQDGRELDWGTAVVRALGCFLSLIVAGLGFFWIIFDRERQGWHDKIAGTIVVRDVASRPLV